MHYWLKRYWLVLYWAGFAWLVVDGGRNPGFVLHPEQVAYPFKAVAGYVILLGALTAWMARLFYGGIVRRAGRWVESGGFIAILLLLAYPIELTDLPGYVYAAAYYAVASALLFTAGTLIRRGRPQTNPIRPPVRPNDR